MMRDAAFVKACSIIERLRKESQHWRKLVYQVSDEQSAANKALTDIAKHCGLKSWTIPQLVESVGVLGDPAALQEALSKMTKERDAQSALVAKQRHLLAAKQTEIGALEAERDALRKIVEMVHADLGIQPGDHIGEAISELKKEASDATARQRMTESRALNYSLKAEEARREIERLRSEVESLRAKLASRTVEWPEWARDGARVVVKSCDSYCTDASIGFEFVIAEIDRGDSTVGDGKGTWASIFDLEPVAEHTQPAVAVQS